MKKWIPLPVAEYTPDMPDFNNPGSSYIANCIPRTPQSYGPFNDLSHYGGAMTLACQGAVSVTDTTGNSFTFSGDLNDLYEFTGASVNPVVVSKGTSPYNCDVQGNWNFELFGQRVIATDYADPMQSFVLGTSTKFDDLANGGITALTLVAGSGYTNGTYALSVTGAGAGTGFAGTVTVAGGVLTSTAITNHGKKYPQTATIAIPAGAGGGSGGSITPTIATIAPQAKYVAAVKNFLMVANTTDDLSGNQIQRVWWSGLNDPTNWPTPGSVVAAEFQSSFNDIFGNFGPITGIVGALGTADAAIFFERAIWRAVYAGPPAVFDFFPCETIKGTSAPNSIVKRGLLVDYLGEDGFYTFDGTNSKPIGANKVDKTFLADLDHNHLDNVIGCADPVNRMTYWAYPGAGNDGGIPNKILAYNWVLDRFSIIEQPNGVEYIFRSLSFGYTLNSMPGGTLNQIQFSLDSSVWTGGVITLAGFDTSHRLSYFSGETLAPTIETSEQAPFDPFLAHISDVRPIVNGGNPMVSLSYRNRLVDPVTTTTPVGMNSIGTCPQIATGRYVKSTTTLNAGDNWTHFQGIEVYASGVGRQ